uniref:(California timema) hypothetical protein n=1 Tax=Timema californicum TaxID=61474 RepID=A0A7R9JEJ8_TIMCA|nr:unnamed protein product [Timema californicum]
MNVSRSMFTITCFGGRMGKDATLAGDKSSDDGRRKVGCTQGDFPNTGFHSTSMQMTKYLYFQDVGYYKMYEGATGGWVNGYETCERDGAHLVIINSEKEAEVVAKIINSQAEENNSMFYVGFHMLYDTLTINPDRTFLTVQGDNVSVWTCSTSMCELALTGNNVSVWTCSTLVCELALTGDNVSVWTCSNLMCELALTGDNVSVWTCSTLMCELALTGQSLNHSGYNIWGYERSPTENYHCGTVDRRAKFDIHSCNLSMPFICEHEL